MAAPTPPACPPPLVEQLGFPDTGGFIAGRWCRDVSFGNGEVSCCLPCPVASWRYSDGFYHKLDAPAICAIIVVTLMAFMVATFLCLPKKATSRHYLTSTPLVGFVLLSTAYIVPLGRSTNQCHDMITPNDNHSDATCAATGLLLVLGVFVVVISCLFRSLSLHLLVCWGQTLGRIFMFASMACIIIGSFVLSMLVLYVPGVSYQLGKVCYINPYRSWGVFWGPLVGVTALTFLFQLLTMAYCVYVVLRPIWHDRTILFPRGQPRSSIEYQGRLEARQASIQTRKILRMQWRPAIIVFMVVFNVALVSTVFITADEMYTFPTSRFYPWVGCLVIMGGDKNKCTSYTSGLGPEENTIVAALSLLAVCGIWGVVLVLRSSMIVGWIELFRGQRPTTAAPLLDPETASEQQFSGQPMCSGRDCELSNLGKYTMGESAQFEDTQMEQAYVVPGHSFSAPGRPKASYLPPDS